MLVRPARSRSTWPLALGLLALAMLLAGACASTPPAASPPAATAPPPRATTAAPPATAVPATAAAAAAVAGAATPPTWRVVANSDAQGANLRAAPAGTAPLVKVLREGTLVLVLGPERREEGRAWRNVQDDVGAVGWVAADLLAEPVGVAAAQAAPASPVETPPAAPPAAAAPLAPASGVTEQPRGGAPPIPAAAVEAAPGQATARYLVPTISCPSCAARITANAKKDSGVLDVAVDLATQRVTVVYNPAKTDPEQIAAAIRKGGDTVLPGE